MLSMPVSNPCKHVALTDQPRGASPRFPFKPDASAFRLMAVSRSLVSSRTRRRPARRATSRCGLTLLEVLIALSIFFTALTAITQLIRLGTRAAVEAQLEADAALRAETILHEVLSGVHVMQNSNSMPFDDSPDWQWSLVVGEGPHIDLLRLDVTVVRQVANGQPQMSVTLSRLVRNPELFLDAALAAEETQ
jgi:general secretion pathway protein I